MNYFKSYSNPKQSLKERDYKRGDSQHKLLTNIGNNVVANFIIFNVVRENK